MQCIDLIRPYDENKNHIIFTSYPNIAAAITGIITLRSLKLSPDMFFTSTLKMLRKAIMDTYEELSISISSENKEAKNDDDDDDDTIIQRADMTVIKAIKKLLETEFECASLELDAEEYDDSIHYQNCRIKV